MTEASLCRALVTKLRAAGIHAFKHNDASTANIPDISMSANGQTRWLEVKLVTPTQSLREVVLMRHPAQLPAMRFLNLKTRLWYCIYTSSPGKQTSVTLWTPQRLHEYFGGRASARSDPVSARLVNLWLNDYGVVNVIPAQLIAALMLLMEKD